MSNVRIHMPDTYHSYGIEFNYSRADALDAPAADFVHVCKDCIRFSGMQNHWFYQSGSNTPDCGYQFFEYWGSDAENVVLKMAEAIAAELGCEVDWPV